MSIEQALLQRSDSKCELCSSPEHLSALDVPPVDAAEVDKAVMVCQTCRSQIAGETDLDVNHWRCLNDSMWSQVPAVQVMAWRMLKRLDSEGWARDLLDMMYLDDDTKAWAENDGAVHEDDDYPPAFDSNGARLLAGDTVTLIKDLNVKGTSFVAKRGTAVRGIGLTDNPEHIEGRVNGTRIVILTKFVKKQGAEQAGS
ncbi:PhnA domain-containing protein [Porticoccaceae bacterium LTM1]|nr:PhnA domain-containing protein [Porticoccaceae bacterium LTM1]